MVSGVEQLRSHLLPTPFDPTGSYPDDVLTRALAFRVLAHAEIESYVEDRALDVSRSAIKHFKTVGEVRRALLALVAFSGLTLEKPPETIAAPQPNQERAWQARTRLDEKLSAAVNAFDHAVRHNHGIKEPNVLGLLLPVGVAADALDPLLLANLSAFGEKRGLAAHSSTIIAKTRQPLDPESEYKLVMKLLLDLAQLDVLLDACMK
jgi:hypothetical protein